MVSKIENVQNAHPDQPSQITPKHDETEKLKKQLEYYAAKVQELENAPKPELVVITKTVNAKKRESVTKSGPFCSKPYINTS